MAVLALGLLISCIEAITFRDAICMVRLNNKMKTKKTKKMFFLILKKEIKEIKWATFKICTECGTILYLWLLLKYSHDLLKYVAHKSICCILHKSIITGYSLDAFAPYTCFMCVSMKRGVLVTCMHVYVHALLYMCMFQSECVCLDSGNSLPEKSMHDIGI